MEEKKRGKTLFEVFEELDRKMAAERRKTGRALIDLINDRIGPPAYGLEIGVSRGRTSRDLLREFDDMFLFLIDPYLPYRDASNNRKVTGKQQARRKTTALKGLEPFKNRYRLMQNFSYKLSCTIDTCYLDFVFIDGLHTTEGVLLDILLYAPKVKKRGLICGHDYNRESVREAVKIFAELSDRVGVIKTTEDNIWYYE